MSLVVSFLHGEYVVIRFPAERCFSILKQHLDFYIISFCENSANQLKELHSTHVPYKYDVIPTIILPVLLCGTAIYLGECDSVTLPSPVLKKIKV